jgi:hypothetical protein
VGRHAGADESIEEVVAAVKNLFIQQNMLADGYVKQRERLTTTSFKVQKILEELFSEYSPWKFLLS